MQFKGLGVPNKHFATQMQNRHGRKYEKVIADFGYESLANYRWLEANGQTAFIKPNHYESSQKPT